MRLARSPYTTSGSRSTSRCLDSYDDGVVHMKRSPPCRALALTGRMLPVGIHLFSPCHQGASPPPQPSMVVLNPTGVHNQLKSTRRSACTIGVNGRVNVGFLQRALSLLLLLFCPCEGRAAVETHATYVFVLAVRPDDTSTVNPIPRIAEREWYLDREHRRAALGRPVESLTCESPSRETPQSGRLTDGFMCPYPTSHFPCEVLVLTS